MYNINRSTFCFVFLPIKVLNILASKLDIILVYKNYLQIYLLKYKFVVNSSNFGANS